MRPFFCKLALLSFLFVSIEGATDIVVDGMLHGDAATHAEEFGHSLDTHGGEVSDAELDGDHCDHCCHGHSSSVTHSQLANDVVDNGEQAEDSYHDQLPDLLLAPPTPPPDPLILS